MKSIKIKDRKFEQILSEKEVKDLVNSCIKKIRSAVKDPKNLAVIGILNGAIPFTNEIVFSFRENIYVDYVKAVSYGNSMRSSGAVELLLDSRMNVEGKDILIVEDIVDSGSTCDFLTEHFKNKGVKSVMTCSMFYNKNSTTIPDIYGMEIEEDFIIGFGLDYAQKGRNLKEIYKLTE